MADKLWDWLHEGFANSEDPAKVELYWAYREVSQGRDDNPQAAVAGFDALTARARTRGESWFEMFCEHWKLQTLLNVAQDPKSALPVAVRCAVEIKKPVFKDFPQRVCLHEDLISAYSMLDPFGYREMIQNALDYMQSEIAPGVECGLCHSGLLADFKTTLAAPDCIDAAFDHLRACENTVYSQHTRDFHRIQALTQICETVALYSPDYARENLADIAFDAFQAAKKLGEIEYLHEILMWLALGQLWRGKFGSETPDGQTPDDEEIGFARSNFERAKTARSHLAGSAKTGYFLAGEAFLRMEARPKAALEFLEEELREIENSGQAFRTVRRRLAKLELLRELNRQTEDEIAAIRAAAHNLKDASWVENAIGAVLSKEEENRDQSSGS